MGALVLKARITAIVIHWCKSNMFHLIKLYQYFCGSCEQAKAFTEVFFIYKTGGEKID